MRVKEYPYAVRYTSYGKINYIPCITYKHAEEVYNLYKRAAFTEDVELIQGGVMLPDTIKVIERV